MQRLARTSPTQSKLSPQKGTGPKRLEINPHEMLKQLISEINVQANENKLHEQKHNSPEN